MSQLFAEVFVRTPEELVALDTPVHVGCESAAPDTSSPFIPDSAAMDMPFISDRAETAWPLIASAIMLCHRQERRVELEERYIRGQREPNCLHNVAGPG